MAHKVHLPQAACGSHSGSSSEGEANKAKNKAKGWLAPQVSRNLWCKTMVSSAITGPVSSGLVGTTYVLVPLSLLCSPAVLGDLELEVLVVLVQAP